MVRGERRQAATCRLLLGIETLDIVELAFLVNVNEHTVFDRLPEAGALHFARLGYCVAVRKDDGRSPLLHVFHRCITF